jgi:type I restriction enzyme S subunit
VIETTTVWPSFPLGDVCRTTSGGTPSRKRADYFQGDIPWVKSGELTDGLVSEVSEFITEEAVANSSAKLFPLGTLLIAMYGATVGKLGILAKPAATNQAVCAIFPAPELDSKFLFWFLRFKRSYLIDQAVGGAQPNISQSILRELLVPVPPIDVQRETVAEIEKQFSRLDEAVANLQRVKANLKRYKASVLKAAVEGRLVETEASIVQRKGRSYETGEQFFQRILQERRAKWSGKRKYKEPVKPEIESLSELPEGWKWVSPEQVSAGEPYSLAIGPFGSSLKVSDYKPEGVPLVFVRNIRSGVFGGDNTVYVSTDKSAELSAHAVEAGDILVTKMGDPPGDVCRYPANRPPAVITADCIKLRLAKFGVDPSFIEYAIASRVVQDQILSITKGVAQLKVNLANFSSIALPLPPFAEQVRIVAEVDRHLSIVREVEAEIETNLQRAQALRQATLAKAFTK